MITTFQEGARQYAFVKDLTSWVENPRDLTEEAFENLKKKLKLGQAESLFVTDDGMVINGNRRLQAYIDTNIEKVWVCIVHFEPETDNGVEVFRSVLDGIPSQRTFTTVEQGVLEYGLALNITDGTWNTEKLAERAIPYQAIMPMETYRLPLGYPVKLMSVLDSFQPSDSQQKPPKDREKDEDTTDDKLDTYENGSVRQIVLYFNKDEYEGTLNKLETVKKKYKLESNTEAFLKLVEFHENHGDLEPEILLEEEKIEE
jgi:hypothetical protein